MRITCLGSGGYRNSRAAQMQSCGLKWLEVGCNIAWTGKHWRLLLEKKQLYPFQIPRLRSFYPNKKLETVYFDLTLFSRLVSTSEFWELRVADLLILSAFFGLKHARLYHLPHCGMDLHLVVEGATRSLLRALRIWIFPLH